MTGRTSRNKGKRAEREVVNLLQPVVTEIYRGQGLDPPVLERNLMQSHRGGYDVVGLEWLALEVKMQETFNLRSWWQQTWAQAQQSGGEPVLFYRRSRVPWRVRMPGYLDPGEEMVVVDIDVDTFLPYFARRLRRELK